MLPNFSMEWSPDHQRTLILYWELVARGGWVMVTLLKYWQHVTALRIRQLYFDKGRTEKAWINCCFPIQGNEHQRKMLMGLNFQGKKTRRPQTHLFYYHCWYANQLYYIMKVFIRAYLQSLHRPRQLCPDILGCFSLLSLLPLDYIQQPSSSYSFLPHPFTGRCKFSA